MAVTLNLYCSLTGKDQGDVEGETFEEALKKAQDHAEAWWVFSEEGMYGGPYFTFHPTTGEKIELN